MQPDIHQTVDHLFRQQWGKLVAVLTKLVGFEHLDTAQDIVQDTLLQALRTWSYNGLPDNPAAWLNRVARNKAIDYLRKTNNFKVNISPQYSHILQSEYIFTPTINQLFNDDEIQDSQLRMMFACCYPSIPVESQIALALKTLCGLSVSEIARAFLTHDETIAKRIYRAKEKIRADRIELELPAADELPSRLDAVLHCLYLLFSEGYNSSHPDELIREELCEEAMRLTFLLTQHPLTNVQRTRALLALICFQASRLRARLDDKGSIILLKQQDRSKWFRPLMNKGFTFLDTAISGVFENSKYHIEAAIASLHASAATFEETDWKGIHLLYQQLHKLHPTPVIALNKAIAKAYAFNKEDALKELLAIEGLQEYYLYHTTIGEIYLELHETKKAEQYFQNALALTPSKKELALLQNKIQQCIAGGAMNIAESN